MLMPCQRNIYTPKIPSAVETIPNAIHLRQSFVALNIQSAPKQYTTQTMDGMRLSTCHEKVKVVRVGIL